MSRAFPYLTLLLLLVVASGASCPRATAPSALSSPVVFTTAPTVAAILAQVNGNTQRVRQLQTNDAQLVVPGMPTLRTSLALERPQRFRLQSGTGLTGTELDIGSNDEYFWMWAKRSDPPAVFYSRHDQFTYASAAGILPIPPHWLIETLGLVELDPDARYVGPTPRGSNQLELQTTVETSYGWLTKVLVVDAQRGHVLQQHVFDVSGQLLASAASSDYIYDPLNEVSLPRRVEVQIPSAQLAFTLEVEGYLINQLTSDPAQLWSMPQLKGYPYTDLTRLAAAAAAASF